MADYASLKAELALTEYAGLSDADAASHFNAKTVTSTRKVPLSVIQQYCLENGIYGKLLARQANNTNPQAQGAAMVMIDIFKYLKLDTLDTSQTAFTQGVSALVAAGDLTPQQASDIAAMASVVGPYYAQTGQFGVQVSAIDMAFARKVS